MIYQAHKILQYIYLEKLFPRNTSKCFIMAHEKCQSAADSGMEIHPVQNSATEEK